MDSVFVVQHLHVLPHEEEDVKLIGVYRSLDAAKKAVGCLSSQPGFSDFPSVVDSGESGFHIDEYILDADHWAEGYVTLGPDD